MSCEAIPGVRIAVARRQSEKSNLKDRTVKSPALLNPESGAPAGGVVEAGVGPAVVAPP